MEPEPCYLHYSLTNGGALLDFWMEYNWPSRHFGSLLYHSLGRLPLRQVRARRGWGQRSCGDDTARVRGATLRSGPRAAGVSPPWLGGAARMEVAAVVSPTADGVLAKPLQWRYQDEGVD